MSENPNLETLVSRWPIANNLSQHLPVGDLITLARTSVALRASLHGFGLPDDADSSPVRAAIHIGHHQTKSWEGLKQNAPFACSSKTHTKGPAPRPCRYCSRPICEACIVRESFARGHENTFRNRCRYLCRSCWDSGNGSRSQRFALAPSRAGPLKRKWYDLDGGPKDFCTCTLKNDCWLCLECKDRQNAEAVESAQIHCHGQGCSEILADDRERRRICLWCDKALPRQIGGTTRYLWNQKMVEARALNAASRQADLEEYNRKRLKLLRMSRREMRGNEAVKGDADADLPQLVRHLDTINYRRYMDERAAPSPEAVYASKMGYWRYTRPFLLSMRSRCQNVRVSESVMSSTREGGLKFARTNADKLAQMRENLESGDRAAFQSSGQRRSRTAFTTPRSGPASVGRGRTREWHHLEAVILELVIVQEQSYEDTLRLMRTDYGFSASIDECRMMLRRWLHRLQEAFHSGGSGRQADDCPPSSSLHLDEPVTRRIQEVLDHESAEALPAEWLWQDENESARQDSGDAPERVTARSDSTYGLPPLDNTGVAEGRHGTREDGDTGEDNSGLETLSPPLEQRSQTEPTDDRLSRSSSSASASSSLSSSSTAESMTFDAEAASPTNSADNVSNDGNTTPQEQRLSSTPPASSEDDPPPYIPGGWAWNDEIYFPTSTLQTPS